MRAFHSSPGIDRMLHLRVHPDHPAPRPLRQAADRIEAGELAVLPSDAGYLLAWAMDAREAEERVIRMRRLDMRHPFTVLCRALGEVGSLAKLDDQAFRLVKSLIPGPYTFVLPPGTGLPKRLKQAKRRTIGCRIPDHAVLHALLDVLAAPLVSTSLSFPDEDADEGLSNHEADEVVERVQRRVDLMLDAGDCPPGPTNVIDLTGDAPRITRPGWRPLELD